jgi:plastocyanin
MERTKGLLGICAGAAALAGALALDATADARPAETRATAVAAAPSAGGVDPRAGGFEVALGEWAISLEAPAIRPGPVTFVIRNRGTLRHGLELELRRVDGRDDDADDDAKSIKLFPGGATRMTLRLAPGVYELECFISHHDELGMRGVLQVRADAPLLKPPAAPASATVAISGFAFKPATLRTTVGKTVTWRNADAAPHTATGQAFSSPQLGKGGSFKRRFTRAGTYAYICALHPEMRGKVVVGAG